MSAVVETAVKARKRHWCEEYGAVHAIQPGDIYVRCVAFPDGDVNTGTQPWVLKICAEHFTQYGKTVPQRISPGLPTQPTDAPDASEAAHG